MSLHETAIELLQAGFHPARDYLLWFVLENILKTAVQNAIKKCNIPLPEGSSTHALVITGETNALGSLRVLLFTLAIDPLGVLEEDEIYYRSSQPIKNIETQTLYHTVTGTVLVSLHISFKELG